MAIKPDVQLAPNVTAATGAYPYGSSKNETVPGLFDGTPYNLIRANDIFGLQQALLVAAGIVPSGSADTAVASQYIQAIVELASGRAQAYDDSGAVNAYVLGLRANQQGPAALFDGFTVIFPPSVTNTGASTANVNAFGVKSIVLPGNVALAGGELVLNQFAMLIYNSILGKFVLQRENQATTILRGIVELATNTEVQNGLDPVRAVTPAGLTARTATETRTGVIELATNTEVQNGLDPVRAVTPAGLTARTAAETRTGIAEIATIAEVAAAADDTRIVTPLKALQSPSALKFYANIDGIGVAAINESFNIAGLIDHGTGDYALTIDNNMATTTYPVSGSAGNGGTTVADLNQWWSPSIRAVGSIRFGIVDESNVKQDASDISVFGGGQLN